MLSGQGLDRLELHHVSARVAPSIRNGALGLNHAQVLVHHQSAGMHLEDLGGHAERENRLVEVERGVRDDRNRGRDWIAWFDLRFLLGRAGCSAYTPCGPPLLPYVRTCS